MFVSTHEVVSWFIKGEDEQGVCAESWIANAWLQEGLQPVGGESDVGIVAIVIDLGLCIRAFMRYTNKTRTKCLHREWRKRTNNRSILALRFQFVVGTKLCLLPAGQHCWQYQYPVGQHWQYWRNERHSSWWKGRRWKDCVCWVDTRWAADHWNSSPGIGYALTGNKCLLECWCYNFLDKLADSSSS